jgi:hypothetical protein
MSEMSSHPPVVVVDGSAWNLSNLTSDKYDNRSESHHQVGPECDTSSRRRTISEENSYMAFASYPAIDDIPEALDVDDIFQKLRENNLVILGKVKVANSHLPSRSRASFHDVRKQGAEYRPSSSRSSGSRGGPVTEPPVSTPSPRESTSNLRERRARHHDRYRFDRTEAKLRVSVRPERQISQSEILRQAMDARESRPGDDIVSGQHQQDVGDVHSSSTYEAGRQQAYERQPIFWSSEDTQEEEVEEEEERMLVEVTPGNYVPLRGSAEIWDAVLNDNAVECFCFGCSLQLVTVSDADMVMCVSCHTISPVDDGNAGGGLGLGMKSEDAAYERRRFEEARRKGGGFL